MPSDFGQVLLELLRERKISVRRLAGVLRVRPPTLWGIIAGRRPLPAARVAEVADALGLSAAERRRFAEATALARCPAEVAKLVARLRAENRRLRAEVERLRAPR